MGGGPNTLRNTIVLVAGLLVFWQLMYWIIGDVAMRSPWQTMRYTVTLAQTDLFWVHLTNTLQAFAVALVIAVVLGLLIGFALGLHRLSAEAMGRERLVMGLRLEEGIPRAPIEGAVDATAVARLASLGLIEQTGERLRVTPAGMLLLDAILTEIAV